MGGLAPNLSEKKKSTSFDVKEKSPSSEKKEKSTLSLFLRDIPRSMSFCCTGFFSSDIRQISNPFIGCAFAPTSQAFYDSAIGNN